MADPVNPSGSSEKAKSHYHGEYKVSPTFKKFWEQIFHKPISDKLASKMTDQFIQSVVSSMNKVLKHALKVQKEIERQRKKEISVKDHEKMPMRRHKQLSSSMGTCRWRGRNHYQSAQSVYLGPQGVYPGAAASGDTAWCGCGIGCGHPWWRDSLSPCCAPFWKFVASWSLDRYGPLWRGSRYSRTQGKVW